MAQRPGGPLGDYVSQTEYATENIKERQAAQAEDKQQLAPPPDLAASSFSRPPELARTEESPKLTPDEKMAAYNESITDRNNAERAERSGPQTEQADEKKSVYEELAQKVAEQQKQESPGLDQSRQQQPELGD